jgi:hypothetical protein
MVQTLFPEAAGPVKGHGIDRRLDLIQNDPPPLL